MNLIHMKQLFKLFHPETPIMDEETATMLQKYDKKCTREDVVAKFVNQLNKDIYGAAKFGNDHIIVTHIPTEALLNLKQIVASLQEKHFQVGYLIEPCPVLAIKWDIPVNSIAINKSKK